jgi:hypothetical protein
MKHLGAALILGFLASSFCFAQTQTGNASYNASKTGFTISHSSLSFNTRVKVTNLRNGRSVEAVVDYRIPISTERIADISRDAGDALELGKTGLTLVESDVLPNENASVPAAGTQPPPSPPAGTEKASPAPQQRPSPAPQQQASPAPREQPLPPQILPLQTVTDVQYIPVPGAGQFCCNTPLLLAILILLILAVLCLVVILVLLLRHLLLWPWHYKVWYRRHLLYAKKRRN